MSTIEVCRRFTDGATFGMTERKGKCRRRRNTSEHYGKWQTRPLDDDASRPNRWWPKMGILTINIVRWCVWQNLIKQAEKAESISAFLLTFCKSYKILLKFFPIYDTMTFVIIILGKRNRFEHALSLNFQRFRHLSLLQSPHLAANAKHQNHLKIYRHRVRRIFERANFAAD